MQNPRGGAQMDGPEEATRESAWPLVISNFDGHLDPQYYRD